MRSVTRVDDQLLGDHALKFVGSATSGLDHIDREALARRDIPFAYAPGSNADSVIEYVLSAIANCGDKLERLVAGAELGIIGYGNIGARLRQRLSLLGIKCRVYDPWLMDEDYPGLVSLAEVLACKVISLHAELTRREPWPSYHMLDREQLSRLRPDALLINAGRGELINPVALQELLESDPSRQIVLDVWEGEPCIDSSLLLLSRFATPHIAGYSFDGKLLATHMLYLALCKQLGLAVFHREPRRSRKFVAVPPGLEGCALLRWLLEQTYDINRDDADLRAAMPDGFDRLRRDYPRRRELGAYSITNSDELTPQSRQLCAAMGCALD